MIDEPFKALTNALPGHPEPCSDGPRQAGAMCCQRSSLDACACLASCCHSGTEFAQGHCVSHRVLVIAVIIELADERGSLVGRGPSWMSSGHHDRLPLCGRFNLRYLGRAGMAWIT
jgi:hypothetical protein